MTVRDEELMMYYDGELSAEEAASLEQRLRADPRAREVLAGLEQLGDVVRTLSERRVGAHGDVADTVMSRLTEERRGGAAGGSADPDASSSASRRAAMRWAAPVVAGALALAAGFFLVLRNRVPADPVAPRPTAVMTARTPEVVPGAELSEQAGEEDVEPEPAAAIQAVDFGAHNGTIFMVSGHLGATPVVWLDESSLDSERMKPL
jgi:anti-sigma factor RsiW